MAAKDDLGRLGEDLAVQFLQKQGWQIVQRNWRCTDGEIDIVAIDGAQLVICEVKTRSSTSFGHPIEAITEAKAHRLRRLGVQWKLAHGVRVNARYDVISIIAARGYRPSIDHQRGVL